MFLSQLTIKQWLFHPFHTYSLIRHSLSKTCVCVFTKQALTECKIQTTDGNELDCVLTDVWCFSPSQQLPSMCVWAKQWTHPAAWTPEDWKLSGMNINNCLTTNQAVVENEPTCSRLSGGFPADMKTDVLISFSPKMRPWRTQFGFQALQYLWTFHCSLKKKTLLWKKLFFFFLLLQQNSSNESN